MLQRIERQHAGVRGQQLDSASCQLETRLSAPIRHGVGSIGKTNDLKAALVAGGAVKLRTRRLLPALR